MKFKKAITIISIVCILATVFSVSAFATVTETNGDGYALYNGVKLPDIDSVWTDKEMYPYAVITRSVDGVIVFLSLSNSQWYRVLVAGSPDYLSTDTDGEGITFCITEATNGEWMSCPQFIPGFDDVDYITLWSNSSLVAEDEENIYLAASVPISLDGMNVIEWDGNGIDIDSSFVRVADYVDAVSGVAVYYDNVEDTRVVGNQYYSVGDGGWVVAVDNIYRVIGNDGSLEGSSSYPIGTSFSYALLNSNGGKAYTSLFAYRTTEAPPDEGGSDDDEPHPPLGG